MDERGALIDGNHPFAGKTLYFEVVLEAVREATAEEIERGYADEKNPLGDEEEE